MMTVESSRALPRQRGVMIDSERVTKDVAWAFEFLFLLDKAETTRCCLAD